MAVLSLLESPRQQAQALSIANSFQDQSTVSVVLSGVEAAIHGLLNSLERRDELEAEREQLQKKLAQQAQVQVVQLRQDQPDTSQQQHTSRALSETWNLLHPLDSVTSEEIYAKVKQDLFTSQVGETPQFGDNSSIIGDRSLNNPYAGTLTFADLPETEARSWRDPEAPQPPEAPWSSSQERFMTMTFADRGIDEQDPAPFVEEPSPTQLDGIRATEVPNSNERYSTMSLDVVDFSRSSQDWRQAYYLEARAAA
jgi:hypothetical protein